MLQYDTHLSVQWPIRQESLEDCAQRTVSHFGGLATLTAALGPWRRSFGSDTLLDVTDVDIVGKRLLKGQNRTDELPRRPIPELGYYLNLWTARESRLEAHCSIHCGSYAPGMNNHVKLKVYEDKNNILSGPEIIMILRNMITVWDAALGVAYFESRLDSPPDTDESTKQLAFFEGSRAFAHPLWSPKGSYHETFHSGTLWVDETVLMSSNSRFDEQRI